MRFFYLLFIQIFGNIGHENFGNKKYYMPVFRGMTKLCIISARKRSKLGVILGQREWSYSIFSNFSFFQITINDTHCQKNKQFGIAFSPKSRKQKSVPGSWRQKQEQLSLGPVIISTNACTQIIDFPTVGLVCAHKRHTLNNKIVFHFCTYI